MAAEKSPQDKLQEEAKNRLAECRKFKALYELDFKEAYFFATPIRQRQISSMSAPPEQRIHDAAELFTDLAFEITGDFVTEIMNTYMPEAQRWCERGRGMFTPEKVWNEAKVQTPDGRQILLKDQVLEDDGQIFEAIKASNLYSELPKAFNPDLAIGTCALWIDRPTPSGPIQVLTVPIRELEINLGPNGEIDDRFAVRWTRNQHVQSILGNEIWEKVDADLKKKIEAAPTSRTEVRKGFWRKWDEPEECWQHVVTIKDDLVHSAEIRGEGAIPLLTMRFNPSADWPWGLGPLLQALPSYRQVDELESARVVHTDLSLRPPVSFPDDSFANVEQGLEPGMAYPIRPGSEGAIKNIYQVPPPDAANYAYEEKVHRLRRLHFVDMPEQRGDTPPTLGQWLDEMARAQRRIGTPGMPFWREGPAAIFLRFQYLLQKAGVIMPLQVDGRAISTRPMNPAQRAAEQQEVASAAQCLQLAAGTFPEEFKMVVDGRKTIAALVEKMRTAGIVKLRSESEVAAFIQNAAQLIGSQMGAPPQQPGQAPAA